MSANESSGTSILLYTKTALVNFFAAACLGLTLRYAFVSEISINYKNVMHAHSHVAMLGWIYLILIVQLQQAFGYEVNRSFSIVFWLTECTILGMLFSFPFEGYGPFSITFSTLFIFLAYFFLYKTWKALAGRKGHDILVLKTAMVWFFISTLGIWAMGPIMAGGAKSSAWYYMAIQFFLHFQFNGWFIFAVLALVFNQLNKIGAPYATKDFKAFFYLLVISCLLTFALAVTWADPEDFLFIANGSGVIIQLAALFYLFRILNAAVRKKFKQHVDSFTLWFFRIALISFVAKILIQSAVVIPQIAVISYTIRLYVLGFIHLIMLGAITAFLLGYGFMSKGIIYKNILARTGWIVLIIGFIVSELILFGQGTLLWAGQGYVPDYYMIIFLVSILMPAGILLALFGQTNKQETI